MIKKAFLIVLVHLLLIISVGCDTFLNKDNTIPIDNKTSITKLINTKNVSAVSVWNLCTTDYLFDLTATEIAKTYEIGFLRNAQSEGQYYTVWYNETSKTLVIALFSLNGTDYHLLSAWDTKKALTAESFSDVEVGITSRSAIFEIDPCCHFEGGSYSGTMPYSLHHLIDGSTVAVHYDYCDLVSAVFATPEPKVFSEEDSEELATFLNSNKS